METLIPKPSAALTSLLRADLKTQWRNRRSVVLLLLVPIVILIAWKGIIEKGKMDGAFALASCITIGLTAVGLMGYSNAIARDRDKGVFQRLRVTPVPTWSIMVSRLTVQSLMIMLISTFVFIVGSRYDKVNLSASAYALTYLTSFVGGALYLGLGQMIVGLVKNPETVNAVTRLLYFIFIMVGMFGDVGVFGNDFKKINQWTSYGTVKTILASSMHPDHWNNDSSIALLVTAAYAVVFIVVGIRNFQWS